MDELGEGCGVDEEDRERDFDGGGGYSLRSMNNCAFDIFTIILNFEGNEYSFSQTHRSTFLIFNSSSNSLILKILFSTSRES